MQEKENKKDNEKKAYTISVVYGDKKLEDCMKKIIQAVTNASFRDQYTV